MENQFDTGGSQRQLAETLAATAAIGGTKFCTYSVPHFDIRRLQDERWQIC
jgi:hypothetical protein